MVAQRMILSPFTPFLLDIIVTFGPTGVKVENHSGLYHVDVPDLRLLPQPHSAPGTRCHLTLDLENKSTKLGLDDSTSRSTGQTCRQQPPILL